MEQAYVGRQPIFDRALRVHAFELLFRSGNHAEAGVTNGDRATAQVLVNTFVEIGLERVVGNHTAFLNVPSTLLASEDVLVFPRERVVIEILEHETVNDRLVARVQELADSGYQIALDDFIYHPRWDPLLPIADIVKVEVAGLDPPAVQEQVNALRPYGKKLLAEKVETREEFEAYKEMGFDYFQGYFLSRPEVLQQECLSTNKVSVLRLLAEVQKSEIEIEALEDLLRQDLALSYKLMTYINSAFFAHREKIDSIKHAVVYLGVDLVKRWVTLLALSTVGSPPAELMRTALVRAAMCERLCQLAGYNGPEGYFVTGLFSPLDAIMGRPLPEVLERLPLSDEVKTAILEFEGPMGRALSCVLNYERCQWDEVGFETLEEKALLEAYLASTEWAFEVSTHFSPQG